VAIGDLILDVGACAAAGLVRARPRAGARLRAAVAQRADGRGRPDSTALRHAVFALLDADAPGADETQDRVAPFLVPRAEAELFLPAEVGDYTDFYASVITPRTSAA